VLSPSTSRFDRKRKLPICHREGVGHAWLLDPTQRSLEVFRRTPEGWLLVGDHDGADVVRAEPFAAVALDLSMLWVE
jgi:Uma2 family endonuclease